MTNRKDNSGVGRKLKKQTRKYYEQLNVFAASMATLEIDVLES